jgi:hypothetical protein
VQFNGYFNPPQSGMWTFNLGYTNGIEKQIDDFGMLFIGEPRSTIVPNSTYSGTSTVPSNTTPVIYGNYYPNGNDSTTLYLNANNYYPVMIYFSQTGGAYNIGLGFSYNGADIITDFSGYISINYPIACFKEDSNILTDSGYIPIQYLKKGDMVKTFKNGYKPIVMIGKQEIHHIPSNKRIKEQLYKCSQEEYPEIFEDLILTGCHSILVNGFKDNIQRDKTIEVNGDTYVTDTKYRLPACVDERTIPYEIEGTFTIYHFALENEKYYWNYGIYANGLLVESCSQRYLKELSNMTLIE